MIKSLIRTSSNFYEILGIDINSSSLDIKKAYYSLAKKYHPDASGGSMSEKFRQLNEAYATLIDPERKEDYDRRIMNGINNQSSSNTRSDFNPNNSQYTKFWQKTQKQEFQSEYEQKRKEHLQKYKESILGEKSPLIQKMSVDNYTNVRFGVLIGLTFTFLILNSIKSQILTPEEREYSVKLQETINLILQEKREKEHVDDR